ncbi:MAG: hypothetical protein WDO15_29595 [Bacteroidota bacterium]
MPLLLLQFGCDDHGDPQGPVEVNEIQKAAISMRGKWGSAFDVSLPFGTTQGVLNDLTMDFRSTMTTSRAACGRRCSVLFRRH